MELFSKYSLYWKSLMPFCEKLMAVPQPILIMQSSHGDHVLRRWNKMMDIKARAVNPDRFNCYMPGIRRQHQDPDGWGYGYLWAEARARKRKEFYNQPFVYNEWLGTDYETQKEDHEILRRAMDREDALILEHLTERTPYNCPDWSEEDWDREEAEFIDQWKKDDVFSRNYLFAHLRTLYRYPFSAAYRLDFWVRVKCYLSSIQRRPERNKLFREIMESTQRRRIDWRKDRAEGAQYREFLCLSQEVYAEKNYGSIYYTYQALKKEAEQRQMSMEPHLQALRDASAQRKLSSQSVCH